MPEEISMNQERQSRDGQETPEVVALRAENAQLLHELENAYAQLTAIMQVSQDETRIAYSELQEKLVVLEKKLFEVDLMADVGNALAFETHLESLRHTIVEKICLAVPVDLVALHLEEEPREGTHRERDLVFETWIEGDLLQRIRQAMASMRDRPYPLIVADLHEDADHRPLRLRPDARSAAALPLRSGRFLGLLILNSRLPSNFREDQEPLLAGYARQASIALRHALNRRRLENALVHILRQQRLPLELLAEGHRVRMEDPRFDRVQEAVRRLSSED
jgi:GAF domain-containing protein